MLLWLNAYLFIVCFRCADGGVFNSSELCQALEGGKLGVPPAASLEGDHVPLPFTIIADDAFALKEWLLKPYPHRMMTREERIFNYRLSRGRRIVENAFGILSNRWRVLSKKMEISPERAELVTLAACSLHNMLRTRFPNHTNHLLDREDPTTHHVTDGEWRTGPLMKGLDALKGNNATNKGKAIRRYLTAYFQTEHGAVSWQERQARINF